jgi:hypothetical protein
MTMPLREHVRGVECDGVAGSGFTGARVTDLVEEAAFPRLQRAPAKPIRCRAVARETAGHGWRKEKREEWEGK